MKKVVCIFLSILCLCFIFFNSSQNGTESNIRSNTVVEKVIEDVKESDMNISIISKIRININEFNLLIRKFAHGFEFGILSITLFISFSFFTKNKINTVIYTLFLVLIFAVIDEFLQLYIPGRSSSVKDVVIDFIGGCLGIIVTKLLGGIKCKNHDKITKNKIEIL
ncbi:acetobutylicum phosphotransbutyrylase [Clostridium botulinum]|nr:acetobutylicum phosphotransbutyrylase [Clostridium botulinum]